MNHLLQEDDCAPDARESFDKDMKFRFGFGLEEFKKNGTLTYPDELTMEWRYKGFVLSYAGDAPWHVLDLDEENRENIIALKSGLLGMSRMSVEYTVIPLPCRRCNNTEREQPTPGLCSWCHAVAYPDSDTSAERQEEIDRRIRQMKEVHELDIAMDEYQRAQWIEAGKRILGGMVLSVPGREGTECREGGIGLGPK